MPRRKTQTTETRLATVEAEVQDLTQQLLELGATLAELETLSSDVDELRAAIRTRKANPDRRRELTPDGKETRARNAAIARSAKGVGRGQGKVRTKAMQQKLRAAARRHMKKDD